jgi:hypothetical protein
MPKRERDSLKQIKEEERKKVERGVKIRRERVIK